MMTSISRSLLPCTLALALAACGTSDDTSTATDAGTTTDPTATTTGATDPTTGAIDPCDACGANAVCVGQLCECDAGFEGDGITCDDVDECAGDNNCAVDATCNNTPGDFDCACNPGYKGNGEVCNDIDECNEDEDNCSVNANCTNQDGAFKCECKPGFNGDGVVCNGSKKFGDPCTMGEDCASGLCLTDGPGMCTITCTQAVANDCGGQGVAGLCAQVAVDTFVCAGDLTFGADKDDAIMQDGDTVKRMFQTKTDADLFHIEFAVAGTYLIAATPDLDDDIRVEFYNADASERARLQRQRRRRRARGRRDHDPARPALRRRTQHRQQQRQLHDHGHEAVTASCPACSAISVLSAPGPTPALRCRPRRRRSTWAPCPPRTTARTRCPPGTAAR